MRRRLAILLLLPALAGCASTTFDGPPPPVAQASGGGGGSDEDSSAATTVLLYIPNRVLDACDMVRFGVSVGPGFGVEAQATEFLQAKLLSALTVGVGFQTLRHLPLHVGPEASLAAGPVGGSTDAGILSWYRSPSDFRFGFHLFVIGFHVAVDPLEIVDLPLGVFTIDVADDDFGTDSDD